jgi:hypothetical protein
MWLVTTNGFYSIVRKPWDREAGTLTVRARARADLESLRAKYLPELGEIQESTSTDYRFRAQAPQAKVAEAVRRVVADIDYDNFKDAVAERQGLTRERVYHRVWHELLAIQTPRQRPLR